MATDATQQAGTPQETPLANVALFENQFETRADARLARRAILGRWRPKPEHTEAVLTKATVKALEDQAKLADVIAVAKLHLEAHKTVVSDEHHGDRMEYAERALAHRIESSGGPMSSVAVGVGVNIGKDTDVGAEVRIYLPDNGREQRDEPDQIVNAILANP